jgi:CTP-dependent riboflavin kinase
MQDYFQQLKSDYESIFSTEVGKRVLEDIQRAGNIKRSIFNENGLVMARDEGMRTLALHVIDMATPVSEKKQEKVKAVK